MIPRFSHFIRAEHPFSFRNVLTREYNRIVSLFGTFAILDVIRNLAVTGKVYMEPLYITLLVAALIFWAVVRYLVKRTNFLYIEGR